jgi:hypothetical protein
MASAVLTCPLRASNPSDAPIAITYVGPTAAANYMAAQIDSHLISALAGDMTAKVMTSTTSDKYGNFTIPGLSAFVNFARTCNYTRDLGRYVSTPIDANVTDITYANIPNDDNLNRQRFLMRALLLNGRPAGARYKLTTIHEEQPTDPFMLVYRDTSRDHDRPVVIAIAKPLENGNLLCAELSLREMLMYFGGHSKHSVFTAERCPRLGLGVGMFNSRAATTTISVWGDDQNFVTLVDEDQLEADSINPLEIKAMQPDDGFRSGLVMLKGFSWSTKESHFLDLNISLTFPESTCSEFSAKKLKVYNPASLAALFGCHEKGDVACIPGKRDAMIAASDRLVRPLPPAAEARHSRNDMSVVSSSNIVNGRRSAVKQCDLRLQRHAQDDALMDDGQYLPGHPEYEKIEEEMAEVNYQRELDGKPPLADHRLGKVPSPKRQKKIAVLVIDC